MNTIYIIVEGGVVHGVTQIPPGIEIVIIDHDIEGLDADRITVSPLNGEACCLATYDERSHEPTL